MVARAIEARSWQIGHHQEQIHRTAFEYQFLTLSAPEDEVAKNQAQDRIKELDGILNDQMEAIFNLRNDILLLRVGGIGPRK